MSTIELQITITVDDNAWADHFNLETAQQAGQDACHYLTSPEALQAVHEAVRAITGAPITVAVTHRPARHAGTSARAFADLEGESR